MTDLSRLSNEELYRIAGVSPKSRDFSRMSDDELFKIAGVSPPPPQTDARDGPDDSYGFAGDPLEGDFDVSSGGLRGSTPSQRSLASARGLGRGLLEIGKGAVKGVPGTALDLAELGIQLSPPVAAYRVATGESILSPLAGNESLTSHAGLAPTNDPQMAGYFLAPVGTVARGISAVARGGLTRFPRGGKSAPPPPIVPRGTPPPDELSRLASALPDPEDAARFARGVSSDPARQVEGLIRDAVGQKVDAAVGLAKRNPVMAKRAADEAMENGRKLKLADGEQTDRLVNADMARLEQAGLAPPKRYAYRVRDVGEEGVPSAGHAQASMSEADVRRMAPSRTDAPQEVVKVNLDRLSPDDFTTYPRRGEDPWVKFNRGMAETDVERVGPITETDRLAARKAPPALRRDVAEAGSDSAWFAARTGLSERQAAKGVEDVRRDAMHEFSPEAVQVKRAVLESGGGQPPAAAGQVEMIPGAPTAGERLTAQAAAGPIKGGREADLEDVLLAGMLANRRGAVGPEVLAAMGRGAAGGAAGYAAGDTPEERRALAVAGVLTGAAMRPKTLRDLLRTKTAGSVAQDLGGARCRFGQGDERQSLAAQGPVCSTREREVCGVYQPGPNGGQPRTPRRHE